MDSNLVSNLKPNDLVFGVPLIVGAKKGLPNFNEFAMQSVFNITRKAQLWRPTATADRPPWRTNVMYILSVSNAFGVETWNSYRTNYTRPVTIYVTNMLAMAFTMTPVCGGLSRPRSRPGNTRGRSSRFRIRPMPIGRVPATVPRRTLAPCLCP